MGGGQFYLYMYGLLCMAVSFMVTIGAGLIFWGRRRERLQREARLRRREESKAS